MAFDWRIVAYNSSERQELHEKELMNKVDDPSKYSGLIHSGYCEGELCCIESAVGAEYIGE
jgi:hypothetical protein